MSSYLLELQRWNVKNDGTDAPNTSNGINAALVWAAQQNYTEVVLPKGTYLIDETIPIQPQSYMTINLNGSTMRIRDNGLQSYSIVSFNQNQLHSRITNGTIEGDKDRHNYSSGGTHEGGYGIQVGSYTPPLDGGNNTRFLTIDDLKILNCTGDAITLNSTFGQIFPTPKELSMSWEKGDINTQNGQLISTQDKIRSNLKVDLNQSSIKKYGYFGLYGNGYGNLGSDIITDFYNIIFYRSDNTFLSSQIQIQFFDEVEVPSNASYARIVLHQSLIPASDNCLINVRVPSFPKFITIQNCELCMCRRQGITISGAKNVFIRNNDIHHIGGTPPQAGIDIEDGYDLNQYIYIEKNNFHNNYAYNIVVVNGKSIEINDNRLTETISGGASLAINDGTDEVVITNNTILKSKVILGGNILLSNNHVYGSQINILGSYKNRPINVSNNEFHNCKLVIDHPFSYNINIDGCRFHNDLDKPNVFPSLQWTLELKNAPQTISNCIFEGIDKLYTFYIPSTIKSDWIFTNTIFTQEATLIGKYTNCTFIGNITTLGVKGTTEDQIELIGCKIISKDRNNTLITVNNIKTFRMYNCYIEKPNGYIFKGQRITDSIDISNNTIKITNDSLLRSLLLFESSFEGNSIIIKDNVLKSTNLNQIGIENATINNPQIILTNNILIKATIKTQGYEISKDNIIDGVIKP
ncbi:right-handed parallel beta-helix repeat-containing protein [Fictibacillus enclensis]|uniref:right-handed parallel beta-helix repeat-containing protein n=1 Tax=Fictibacillus enclensis TaxID=1017270 RepID=UPI0024BF6458|nr:right-handed parallel beta-helix repeat-containing protein [Fictibacillus enclensis]WHY71034.1 right-handed parallel beta-helix repeat-containing protein [Fictibacillus enclensis]